MDLNKDKSNTAIQTFEVPFYMEYNTNGPLYVGNPTLANIGDFENPEFIVSAIVMKDDNQIAAEDFCYRFYRRVETSGSIGDSYTPLTTGCSENPGIDDKPFEGLDMSKIDSYTVYYKIEIFKRDGYNVALKTQPLTTAAIKYTEQREKEEEEKKKLPLTIIIIILAAVVVISAAFVIFCVLRNKKQKEEAKNNDVPIEDVVKSSDRQRVPNRSEIASGIEVQRIEPIELEVSRNNK